MKSQWEWLPHYQKLSAPPLNTCSSSTPMPSSAHSSPPHDLRMQAKGPQEGPRGIHYFMKLVQRQSKHFICGPNTL